MRTAATCMLALGLGACAMPADDSELKAEAAQATFEGKADWSRDLCEERGWYEDDECDWFCPHRDPVCSVPALGEEPAGVETRYPIVLAHGFMAGPEFIDFNGVADALRADGHVVYEPQNPPFNTVAVRAESLAAAIDEALEETGAPKVNLIAHSMGGLDARYVISSLGYGDRVASLTTISTPHRGSRGADMALAVVTEQTAPIVDGLLRSIGRTRSQLASDPDVRGALLDLSESAAPAFNADNPDDPRVSYRSWAGVSNVFGVANPLDDEACEGAWLHHPGTHDVMDAMLVATAQSTAHGGSLVPNDGMVTVDSARWGTFRGCIPADHADEVGQFGDTGPDRYTGFDHLRLYRNIAFGLSDDGF